MIDFRSPIFRSPLSVDWADPLTNHSLNMGLIGRWIAHPGAKGGITWKNLLRGGLDLVWQTPSVAAGAWSVHNEKRPYGWGAVHNSTTTSGHCWQTVPFDISSADITIAKWVRHRENADTRRLWEIFISGERWVGGYWRNTNGGQVENYESGPGHNSPVSAASSVPLNEWRHVALRLDNTNGDAQWFVNGEPSGSSYATPASCVSTATVFTMDGHASSASQSDNDDISLYNRALSNAEFRALYIESITGYPLTLRRWMPSVFSEQAAAPAGGRIMSSLAGRGGLAGHGGIGGKGGGLAA